MVALITTPQLTTNWVTDATAWDAIATQSAFMQSWAWGVFQTKRGFQVRRCGVFEGTKLVAGAAFQYYPHESNVNLLLSPGGPFFLPGYESIAMPLLLEQAKQFAIELRRTSQNQVLAWRIEPLLPEKSDFFPGFMRAPVDWLPSETLLVDLQPSESEILQSMPAKGRYNIRLADRHQVQVEFSTSDRAISTFYRLFWETVQRQGFFGEPYGFFINLCQTLFAAGMAEIAIATWQDEVLATILIVYWGDRSIYLYGGSSDQNRHVMAPYLLHWQAMQRAKVKGHRFYDLYGFTQNPQHGYAKFSQFKRKFGGQVVKTIGAHDYFFYEHLADTIVQVFQQITLPRKTSADPQE